MNSEIIFNTDLDSATAYVSKIFDAEVAVLWDYFSKPELIDQWWAPAPWKCVTEKMDFREGGNWFYAMVGPDGEKEYAINNYSEIMQHRSISGTDAFTDEKGRITDGLPQTTWLIGFTGIDDGTRMTFNLHFNSREDLSKIAEMGFEEGFKTALNQLEDLLSKN